MNACTQMHLSQFYFEFRSKQTCCVFLNYFIIYELQFIQKNKTLLIIFIREEFLIVIIKKSNSYLRSFVNL